MQIGGGINPDNAAEWLDSGASHLIVTSYIFQDGELSEDRLKELVSHGYTPCFALEGHPWHLTVDGERTYNMSALVMFGILQCCSLFDV